MDILPKSYCFYMCLVNINEILFIDGSFVLCHKAKKENLLIIFKFVHNKFWHFSCKNVSKGKWPAKCSEFSTQRKSPLKHWKCLYQLPFTCSKFRQYTRQLFRDRKQLDNSGIGQPSAYPSVAQCPTLLIIFFVPYQQFCKRNYYNSPNYKIFSTLLLLYEVGTSFIMWNIRVGRVNMYHLPVLRFTDWM